MLRYSLCCMTARFVTCIAPLILSLVKKQKREFWLWRFRSEDDISEWSRVSAWHVYNDSEVGTRQVYSMLECSVFQRNFNLRLVEIVVQGSLRTSSSHLQYLLFGFMHQDTYHQESVRIIFRLCETKNAFLVTSVNCTPCSCPER